MSDLDKKIIKLEDEVLEGVSGGIGEYDAKYRIDKNQCICCGMCIDACPIDAIVSVDPGSYGPFTIDPNQCFECGNCVDQCPTGAIIEW